jgi:hypothetical protein
MTYNLTIEDTEFMGAVKARYADIEISSYNSGGEDLTPNDIGLNRFLAVNAYVDDGSALIAQYDESSEKLIIRGDGDGTTQSLPEASAGTSVNVSFVGMGK